MLLFRRLTKDFDMGVTDAQVKGLISALTKENNNFTFHRFQFLCNNFALKPQFNFFFHWNSNIMKPYTTEVFLNVYPGACDSVQPYQGPNKILFEIREPHSLEGASRFHKLYLNIKCKTKSVYLGFRCFFWFESPKWSATQCRISKQTGHVSM